MTKLYQCHTLFGFSNYCAYGIQHCKPGNYGEFNYTSLKPDMLCSLEIILWLKIKLKGLFNFYCLSMQQALTGVIMRLILCLFIF